MCAPRYCRRRPHGDRDHAGWPHEGNATIRRGLAATSAWAELYDNGVPQPVHEQGFSGKEILKGWRGKEQVEDPAKEASEDPKEDKALKDLVKAETAAEGEGGKAVQKKVDDAEQKALAAMTKTYEAHTRTGHSAISDAADVYGGSNIPFFVGFTNSAIGQTANHAELIGIAEGEAETLSQIANFAPLAPAEQVPVVGFFLTVAGVATTEIKTV